MDNQILSFRSIVILLLSPFLLLAQDPILPLTNLGITNLQDVNVPATGWYYMQYIQVFQTNNYNGAVGNTVGL